MSLDGKKKIGIFIIASESCFVVDDAIQSHAQNLFFFRFLFSEFDSYTNSCSGGRSLLGGLNKDFSGLMNSSNGLMNETILSQVRKTNNFEYINSESASSNFSILRVSIDFEGCFDVLELFFWVNFGGNSNNNEGHSFKWGRFLKSWTIRVRRK